MNIGIYFYYNRLKMAVWSKYEVTRHKIKLSICWLSVNQSNPEKPPEPHREKCVQFRNSNKTEHFVKSTKNQPEKSEKYKMKMSNRLYEMHRKIFCVNSQFVKFYKLFLLSQIVHLVQLLHGLFISSLLFLCKFLSLVVITC